VRIRTHDACKSYAHDCIDEWTNGDGVEEGAVETDLTDKLTPFNADGEIVMDETEAAKILASYPGLARIVAKIRADMEQK
jgi:hypothetical protein